MERAKYNVVRTSEGPVEITNGQQSGLYDVELWERQGRSETFFYTELVGRDLTFDEATALRQSLQFPGRVVKPCLT